MQLALSLVLAVLLVLLPLSSTPSKAGAVSFDSAYAGESAFVTVEPGAVTAFVVFFTNTGSMVWVQGTASEVVLVSCLDDKSTCGVAPEESAWNAGWMSPTVYARQAQTSVLPGEIATFAYQVRAPLDALPGTYRFNGEVAFASTLTPIHPEGYYHDATIPGAEPIATPTPTPTPTPSPTPTPRRTPAPGGATPSPSPPPPPPPLPPPVPPPAPPPD